VLVLDTNVYLDTIVDAVLAGRVAGFLDATSEHLGLSSVVLAELLVGVRPADRARLLRWVTDGIDDTAVLTPTHADWITAGDALRQLGGDDATPRRSFWNDLLIAASCARAGATLVTRNEDDFRRIRRAIPVAVMPRPA
jgi:predicted nucleic acid-binding protein